MNKLSKIEVLSISVGSIIGWGAFMLPGNKFLVESGIINTFIGLSLGALAILIIENSYKYMISVHKDEGGEFSFTYKHLGRKNGFISGWFLGLAYLSIIPLNATALPLVIDIFFKDKLKIGYLYTINQYNVYFGEVIVSSLIIIIFSIINIKGIKAVGKIQSYLAIILVGIVVFISIGMFTKSSVEIINKNYIENYQFSFFQVFKIFAIAPWAFIGFDTIPQLVNNFNFPRKKASTLTILSILCGLLIYTLLNIITALVYSPSDLININWATGEAVLNTLGKIPFFILGIGLLFAVCSGVNGFFVTTNKLMESMCKYKVLPFKGENMNKQIIIFITVTSLLAPWFGREALSSIVDMSSIGAAISYGYVCYITTKKATSKKDKLLGIIGLIISILFVCLLIIPISPAALDVHSMIALFIWGLLGTFYYYKVSMENNIDIKFANLT